MSLTINTIVVPQGAEYKAVCKGLKQAQSPNVRVITIPIGTKDVLQTLVNCSFEFVRPQQVLMLGLCGSLSSQYAVGERLLYQSCCNLQGDFLDLDSELTSKIQHQLMLNPVTGLTSDRPICLAHEKLKLAQAYTVAAVDMESYAYAHEFQRQGISLAVLRVVSDDASGNIPDLSRVINEDGGLNSGQMASSFLRKPFASIRLIRGSLSGLKQLQQVTQELFGN